MHEPRVGWHRFDYSSSLAYIFTHIRSVKTHKNVLVAFRILSTPSTKISCNLAGLNCFYGHMFEGRCWKKNRQKHRDITEARCMNSIITAIIFINLPTNTRFHQFVRCHWSLLFAFLFHSNSFFLDSFLIGPFSDQQYFLLTCAKKSRFRYCMSVSVSVEYDFRKHPHFLLHSFLIGPLSEQQYFLLTCAERNCFHF